MLLKDALGILSKSSPYAVTTSGKPADPLVEKIKNYLFVKTDIECAFEGKLKSIKEEKLKRNTSSDIIFLCGSSGDGKSEILTRYSSDYANDIEFHLDATHSFEPKKTAIETLNERFTKHRESDKALVVGINIGMLANFEREGDDSHAEVKKAISDYLNNKDTNNKYTFLNFESFPKFKILDGEVSSNFFQSLLDRVVRDDSGNHFRDLYNNCVASGNDKQLVANFALLRNRFVQKVIVELLLGARIRKDQFITARMLLDFIYCILTGPGYLFDNLFDGGDNELLAALVDFDPSIIRNKKLDLFILHRNLDFEDKAYSVFIDEIKIKYGVPKKLTPQSAIRLFYLLKYTSQDNNYHYDFRDSFNEESQTLYKTVWEQHKNYSGESSDKKKLRRFYDDIIYTAINKHANRNAPYLSKDEFYISSHNGCDLASEMELSVVYKSIESDEGTDLAAFNVYLEVNEHRLPLVPVGVNLLALMIGIVGGYRPNKHDKNSIVLLDELVAKISEMASLSDVLYLYSEGQRIKLKANADNEIRVSGL